MEERPVPRPWQPKPFSVAVLDSDEYLADRLCERLRSTAAFNASVFYDIAVLTKAQRQDGFDAYVLDYLADWPPPSAALETLIASIRNGPSSNSSNSNGSDIPIFVLGNQTVPERIEGLGDILMKYKVRYVLKPVQVEYLAKRVAEAVAKRAGL
ncbi:hypothetical protein [Noviherbaspirillum aerium]|uniref:hypothetical protein n=1 Tax=Noviherbaspirillum aerium TaxID=2588497 RepID=UPI00124F2176|nr:hypothetical protein [Noviherbaspirillum aerium]